MNDVELAIKLTADASDAANALDSVGSSATSMASDVEDASRKADQAADRLGGVASSADDVASKSSKATGALGALSAGFELAGAEKYATGLQSAAMATDFLSGVGDSLNLVLELQVVQNARARAASIASTVAAKGQAAATKALTVAQRALNLVMRANPIGLIITAVVALVAAFVLLYKRSERFRAIVQAVGRAGQVAIGWVVDKATALASWFGDKVPAAAGKMKDLVVNYIKLITTPWRKLIDIIEEVIGWVRDKIPRAFTAMKNGIGDAIDKVLAPFRAIKDTIQDIIDLIGKIKLPDLSGLDVIPGVPLLRTGKGYQQPAPATSGAGTTINNYININGVLDAPDAAAAIENVLLSHGRQLGYLSA